jgi:NAD(P)-dependent dehydrogenase (short-subunit alcohol dehydrogenase family)
MKILVTGAANGLGKAIVDELIRPEYDVIKFDSAYGDNVCRPDKCMVPSSVEWLDVIINCAGINSNAWFEDVSDESNHSLMNVNAFGIVKMTQHFLEQLKKSRGTVINIVSNAAHIPMTSSLAYNMSKAAALMCTKQMAHELTPKYGITVFSISPNKLAGTEMSKQIEENVQKVRGWSPEYAAEYQKRALMHGLETPPEAVARLIGHLIESGDMKYLSGCDIPFGK